LECLSDSVVPAEMTKAGCTLEELPPGERILHTAITERFARGGDGELEPLTEGSTKPIVEVRTHAGIVRTKRFNLSMPWSAR
jgi:hypothetical protein